MFKNLIERLFYDEKKSQPVNYYYFEESKQLQDENRSMADFQSTTKKKTVETASSEQQFSVAFYNFLFGQSPPTTNHDELSLFVAQKITDLLAQPKSIVNAIPAPPASLFQILQGLNDNNFELTKLLPQIEQEPMVAAKVIELANSSYYNRNNKQIADLKMAFMVLGAKGIIEGVLNGFISKLVPHSSLYFNLYGQKIWQHCVGTGLVARQLVGHSGQQNLAAQAYLVGLVCNLGDMVIYQLLLQAFQHVHPDHQPNSFAFKELMLKNSKKLTYYIAREWHFPSSILEPLALQIHLTKSTQLSGLFNTSNIGCYVYEANLINEFEVRLAYNDIDINAVNFIDSLVYSEQAKAYLSAKLQK